MSRSSSSSSSFWSLRRCSTMYPGTFKIRKKGEDTWCFLFERPHDMARVFIIGMHWAEVTVSKIGGRSTIVITQMSASTWRSLWDTHGDSPLNVNDYFSGNEEEDGHSEGGSGGGGADQGSGGGGADQGGEGGERNNGGGEGGGDSGGAEGGGDVRGDNGGVGGHGQGGGNEGGDGADSINGGPSTLLQGGDALEIIVILRSHSPGEGLAPLQAPSRPMELPRIPENHCVLHATMSFVFGEIVQPQATLQHLNQKLLNLSISTTYELLNSTLHAPSPRGVHIRILHDQLETRFHCTSSPHASVLMAEEALGLSCINLQKKTLSTETDVSMKTVQLQLGIDKFAKGLFGTWESSKSNCTTHEKDQALDVPSVKGTTFVVVNNSDRSGVSTPADVLGFIALHTPALMQINTIEESGLNIVQGEPCSSGLGCNVTVSFIGRFLINGSCMEEYSLQLKRRLGEFIVPTDSFVKRRSGKIPVEDKLAQCVQAYEIGITINHAFSLSRLKGAKLFWYLRRAFQAVNARSPVPELMDLRP